VYVFARECVRFFSMSGSGSSAVWAAAVARARACAAARREDRRGAPLSSTNEILVKFIIRLGIARSIIYATQLYRGSVTDLILIFIAIALWPLMRGA